MAYHRRDRNAVTGCLGAIFIGVVLFSCVFFGFIFPYATKDAATFTVNRLERVQSGNSSYYLVFTEEGEVFKNDDQLAYFKFDSSDVYGRMEEGERYQATVCGWRIHFLSAYRNIIDIKEID